MGFYGEKINRELIDQARIMARVIITIKQIKNINMDILLIVCMALMLKLEGLLGSFFRKK